MTEITLAEQIAAVERAVERARWKAAGYVNAAKRDAAPVEADRLAAALATLRGLEMVEVTQ